MNNQDCNKNDGDYLLEAFKVNNIAFFKQLKDFKKQITEDGVHNVRVSIRRIKPALSFFREIVPSKSDKIKKVRTPLKSILKTLGSLRDLHIQIAYLRQESTKYPELLPEYENILVSEKALRKEILKKLDNLKTKKIKEEFSEIYGAVEKSLKKNKKDVQLVPRIIALLEKTQDVVLRRLNNVSEEDIPAIHQIRICFKKFRYMAEAVEDIINLDERQRQILKEVQTILGDIQDCSLKLEIINVISLNLREEIRLAMINDVNQQLQELTGKVVSWRDQYKNGFIVLPENSDQKGPVETPQGAAGESNQVAAAVGEVSRDSLEIHCTAENNAEKETEDENVEPVMNGDEEDQTDKEFS